MADNLQITITVDAGSAGDEISELRGRLATLATPLVAIGEASAQAAQLQQQMTEGLLRNALQAARAMQQLQASYTEAFKNGMQILVDSKQLSLRQALGFDIDYTAQVFTQEEERLEAIRENDAASIEERRQAVAAMRQLEARYVAETSADYRRLADAARGQADQVARSYEQAFDRVGGSVQRTFNEILTRQTTWAKGMTRMVQEVETFFLEEVESMAAKWAASGLASLAGGAVASAVGSAQGTGASGLAAGLTALIGINQPGGLFGTGLLSGAGGASATAQAAAVAANTTALGASTTALTALTAALTGATAAEGTGAGASLAGGALGGRRGGGRQRALLVARRPLQLRSRRHRAVRRRRLGAAEFRRCDPGAAAREGDGAAGGSIAGLARDDRVRRRRRRAFSRAFPRPRRRAVDPPLVPRQPQEQRRRGARPVPPERADPAELLRRAITSLFIGIA
jgi:hypothetical protein